MTRFEEVQMRLAEASRNHLDVVTIQVFIEQFSLVRECRFSLTLPGMEDPYPVLATVSYTYDVFQSGVSMYPEDAKEDEPDYADNSIQLDVAIRFPVMEGYPDIEGILREVERQYSESEPTLVVKEFIGGGEPSKEYELSYGFDLDPDDVTDNGVMEGIFEELRGVMDLVYDKTRYHIDLSWYRNEDDPPKGN